jgi:hypothetical protein
MHDVQNRERLQSDNSFQGGAASGFKKSCCERVEKLLHQKCMAGERISILHLLSLPIQNASPVCTACWRHFRSHLVHIVVQNAYACSFRLRVGVSCSAGFAWGQ